MPGRQSHGRPLLPTSGGGNSNSGGSKSKSHAKHFKKSRAKATAKALDAFAIAAEQVPESTRGVRTRGLEDRSSSSSHPAKRQRRDEDEDEDEEDGGDDDFDAAPKKRARRDEGGEDGFAGFSDEDGDGGSESEEWHVGVGGEDEDSELDSDEAFGESDEERFEGYAFGGSSSKGKKGNKKRSVGEEEDGEDEEGEEGDEEELESLGSDAIDLATALDQYSEDEEGEEQEGSASEEEDEESTDGDDESEEDEGEDDPSKLDALQSMIAGFAGQDEEEEEQNGTQNKTRLSLKDLGLAGVKDPHIKRSLRLMNKEEKAVKPGSSKKLAVPLAKRQQDRLLRAAAYQKTNETLDRWIETVKHNRRADHLFFPLAQNVHDAGLDGGELRPITEKTSGTELEKTILAIMEESGLGPTAKPEKKADGEGVGQSGLTEAEQREIARQRRRERELHSRELARQKRIKKIKSKAYRRIHRKELLREEQAEREAALAAGELDSEDERELLDRRRAEERMGTRHRESKWAKLGKKAGRAVWDENFRAGLTEIARRKEDLRRRIEGRAGGSDNEDDDGSDVSEASGGGDPRRRLLAELERAATYDDDDEPRSKLMQMKFMQRGEEQRKKENDEAIAELRRQLDSDNEGASDAEETEIGRRQYGMGNTTQTNQAKKAKPADARGSASLTAAVESTSQTHPGAQAELRSSAAGASGAWTLAEPVPSAAGSAGVWAQAEPSGGRSKKANKTKTVELDISNAAVLATKAPKPKATSQNNPTAADGVQDSDGEADLHLPMAIRDQKLIERAFAGEDVHGQFEEEKAEIEKEDDEKEIDNTLPGWGNWVGEGVSNREKKRHQGRFITKVEGVKKKDRKDFKLKDVIVNEKRVRKNDKYLASGLPHPFESQQQYERSLRLPVGPEWSTKETFQDATKPRVIVKQGIIAPMSKPMY
ncbi:Utp14-domain-containing protein [Parathielavia appendiculata]|uniref:Utp14-domain-containing protein n=1 Tax=Parathielavia appendiculata TaxID=2587402 RepID=A0AAN6U8Z8_9PEZI|nr:Utp14-domain-containing protein [Parathielavia appendiculata]